MRLILSGILKSVGLRNTRLMTLSDTGSTMTTDPLKYVQLTNSTRPECDKLRNCGNKLEYFPL